MTGVTNLHWFDSNSERNYPLDDAAIAMASSGQRLPPTILADLSLRYPLILGPWPFLASISVTAKLVSLTIQAASDPDDPNSFAPVAALSLLKTDLVQGRSYALQGQYPGVGGWVVFGDGVADERFFTGRFTARAGKLAPRAARPYHPLPVRSLATLHNDTPLTGIISLVGESPVGVVKERRNILGVERDVAVVRLTSDSGVAVGSGTEINPYEYFAGPCALRPESNNCGPYDPVQAINAVPPDCNGNITIELRGCATIAQVLGECGIVVDCVMGLSDVCAPSTLPAADGTLPNDYPNLCHESQTILNESEAPSFESESLTVLHATLPYTDTFVSLNPAWEMISGQWNVAVGYFSTVGHEATRNLAIYDARLDSSLHKKYTARLILLSGLHSNAALVFNYRPSVNLAGRNACFAAEIDYQIKQFRFVRFNGSLWVPESAFISLPGLQLNTAYTIDVTVTPGTGSNVNLVAHINGGTISATLSLTTNQFLPDIGLCGLHANRAAAKCNLFKVEAV